MGVLPAAAGWGEVGDPRPSRSQLGQTLARVLVLSQAGLARVCESPKCRALRSLGLGRPQPHPQPQSCSEEQAEL